MNHFSQFHINQFFKLIMLHEPAQCFDIMLTPYRILLKSAGEMVSVQLTVFFPDDCPVIAEGGVGLSGIDVVQIACRGMIQIVKCGDFYVIAVCGEKRPFAVTGEVLSIESVSRSCKMRGSPAAFVNRLGNDQVNR